MIRESKAEANSTSDAGIHRPTQLEIAAHLDMSERHARDVLQKIGIDHRAASLEAIRVSYIRYLRELAAGRGGSDQFNLTKHRARQAEADANLKDLEYWTRARGLVPVEELEPILSGWAITARSEFENAFDRILDSIESKYGIEIERDIVDNVIESSLEVVAAYPSNFAEALGEGCAKMETDP